MDGLIHSYQTMATLDGPGIRFLVFLQGCPLRCAYCHNPDTWNIQDYQYKSSPLDVFNKVLRYRSYFGNDGGITLSGGEALLQADFAKELFALCRKEGIHTCLDTSGCIINDDVLELLEYSDLVLLDLKMNSTADYQQYTGGSFTTVMEFLHLLEARAIPTWIRRVIVPGFNDSATDIDTFHQLLADFSCIEKIEFLPFRKLCVEKYQKLNIPFPFNEYREATDADILALS